MVEMRVLRLAAALLGLVMALPATALAVEPSTAPVRLPPGTDFRDKGMRGEVLAFLKAGQLDYALERLDYRAVSTLAYFAVEGDRYGNLVKRTSSGATSAAWAGWTSSKMTTIIQRAHSHKTRVVLTLQVFAWDDAGRQKTIALLSSATARQRLADQLAAAVVARGVDGVNIDIEPVPGSQKANFVTFVRQVRKALNARGSDYQLTFDATGYIANYDITALTAPGAADAVYIMGYQYRGANTTTVGSTAPLGGPRYDVRETIDRYLALTTPDKVILVVPYYGYTWPTETGLLNSRPSGLGRTILYERAMDIMASKTRGYDTVEQVAWAAYRERPCSTCAERWRQIYIDDTRALRAKYDLALSRGLRGAGIWALGYEGRYTAPYALLADRFLITP
jgi:spore germination protein YaaH